MEYRLLGPLEVSVEGRPVSLGPPKQRALLAVLALRVNRVVSTDRLMAELWGDTPPRTAEHSLQSYVSGVRSVLAPADEQVIVTRAPGYQLVADPEAIDVLRFEQLVEGGEKALAGELPAEAASLLEQALDLWRGPPLEDLADQPFAAAEIRRLEELHLRALDRWAEAELALGHHHGLVPVLESLVEEHPLRERLWGHLMVALYRDHRQAEALRVYQRLRTTLADELGIEPSPELQQTEEWILLQDPGLRPPGPPSDAAAGEEIRNPYRGLQPFSEEHAGDYFGREGLTAQLVDVLSDKRLVAVVGPSGCGKSSAVRAGLVPAVRRGEIPGSDKWLIARMLPGAHPYAELEAALLRAAPQPPDSLMEQLESGDLGFLRAVLRILPDDLSELVLVVDQFEELFSLVEAERDRRRFLDDLVTTLTDPHSRLRVVLTLRADFYDRPLLYPDFGRLFTVGVVNVMPLSAEELERAAVRPAAQAGVSFEPALLAELVADVSHQPGALPLFQYALTELFDRRRSGTLTLDAYREIGGLRGALTRRSEELYERLDAGGQEAARQVFLRLVTLTESMEEIRRRVPSEELASVEVEAAAVQTAIDLFAEHRLVTFDRDPVTGAATLEVAHEALLREWERLREWIESSRHDLRRRAALAAAVDEWRSSKRDPDFLLTGNRLEQYERWEQTSSLRLTSPEREFLTQSLTRREEERRSEEARREAERRLQRRARTRLVALVGLFVTLVAGSALATVLLLGGDRPSVALVFLGRGDRGWGDLQAAGLDRAERELEVETSEVVPLVDPVAEVRSLAESGSDLIILGEGNYPEALEMAPEFPDVWFALLDAASWAAPELIEQPNVVGLDFSAQDGSYLVGVAAALTSESGVIGFVGGLDTDVITTFQAGFEAGARSVDPGIEILVTFVSDRLLPFLEGFGNPDLGEAAARRLYGEGADVVYHAAGLSGEGVRRAAVEQSRELGRHLWMIGSDEDEYWTGSEESRPHVLTSMIKRTDEAVFRTIASLVEGNLSGGPMTLGLASGGVGYAESGGFVEDLVPQLEEAKRAIIAGEIVVPTEPTGRSTLIPSYDIADADVVASITFDGETCSYQGPGRLASDQILGLDLSSTHGRPIFVLVYRLARDVPFSPVPTPIAAETFPEGFDVENQVILTVFANSGTTTTATVVPGTYRVGCAAAYDEPPFFYPAADFLVIP